MKNRNLEKLIFTCIFLAIFLLCKVSSCQENQDLFEINNAAQQVLTFYLEKIPNGMECKYGFNDREELKKAKLLNPINVVTPSDDYFSSELIDTSNIRFIPSTNWKIPISVNSKYCCFLQGKFIDGNFKIFGIGGNLLAQQLNALETKLLKYNNMNRCLLAFNDIKKQYLVYSYDNIDYDESICISLEEYLNSDAKIEQNLLKTLYQSKEYSIQQKLRSNEY